MDLVEMKQALTTIHEQTDRKIDVLYMNMCLMGMIEDAYQFRGYVDYYVASEDLQTAWAEPYSGYVSGITADSTPEEVAVHFADTYADVGDAKNKEYTISAADMAWLGEVVSATNDLANALRWEMGTISDTLQTVSSQVQRFNDDPVTATITISDTYVDLYHFADLVSVNLFTHTDILATSTQLMSLIKNNYIIAERHRSEVGYNLDNSHGVSIFLPATASSFYDADCCDFAVGTNWSYVLPSLQTSETGATWGGMLVDYFQATQPDGPDDPTPPEPVARLRPGYVIYLPMISR